MKIKIDYIETYAVRELNCCRYHMADGTIKRYWQLGKGNLQ